MFSLYYNSLNCLNELLRVKSTLLNFEADDVQKAFFQNLRKQIINVMNKAVYDQWLNFQYDVRVYAVLIRTPGDVCMVVEANHVNKTSLTPCLEFMRLLFWCSTVASGVLSLNIFIFFVFL